MEGEDTSTISAESFKKQNLTTLRKFLQVRGVSAGKRSKKEVVDLCIKAAEIGLEKDESSEAYNPIADSIARRTINGFLFPHPRDLKLWGEDSSKFPVLKSDVIFDYLKVACEWPKHRLERYMDDDGWKLFKETHIREVKGTTYCRDGSVYNYFRANCQPETRQNAAPYVLWMLLDGQKEILTGECTCPAGDGTCKHSVAFLFKLQNIGEESSGISCTDGPCQWGTGTKRKGEPVLAHQLEINKRQRVDHHHTSYDPIPKSNLTPEEIRAEFSVLLEGTGALMLTSLKPMQVIEDPDLPRTLINVARESSEKNFLADLEAEYTPEKCLALERSTRGQGKTLLWKAYRKGRITASVFKSAYTYKDSGKSNSVLKRIFQEYKAVDNDATRHGHRIEAIARKKYAQKHKAQHPESTVYDNGLCIDPSCPHLGASPDGFVDCVVCGKGLLEIKAPLNGANMTVAEACRLKSVYCEYTNDELTLPKNSIWYYQVQGQMHITGRGWCDFILFTEVESKVCRVAYDPSFCSKLHTQLDAYYFKWVLPKLFLK